MLPIEDRNIGLEVPTPDFYTWILKEPNVLIDGEYEYFWFQDDRASGYRAWEPVPKYLFDALERYSKES